MTERPPTQTQLTKTEALLLDLETWEGRRDFAEKQIENIRRELGNRGMKGGLILLQGGKSENTNTS